MISTLETELNNVAYAAVKREVYPPSPVPVSDAELKDELKNLKAGKIPRPKTKAEYVALLASIENQISDIKAQNEKAQAEYSLELETIKQKFEADIQTAKTDESNRWKAIRAYRNSLLRECDWTQMPDNQKDELTKNAWKVYRQSLRDIPQTFAITSDVVFPTPPE